MLISQIMTRSTKACSPDMNLAQATELLWTAACGALPVVDRGNKVTGIITDRDICIALGTRNRLASEVMVEQAMSPSPYVCHARDDIHTALHTMRDRKVRRLPVVSAEGKLEGMLCASDVLLHARHDDGSNPVLSYENIVTTLKGIYCHSQAMCACSPH